MHLCDLQVQNRHRHSLRPGRAPAHTNADDEYNNDHEDGPAEDQGQHEWASEKPIDWSHNARRKSEGDQSRQHEHWRADQRQRGRTESDFGVRFSNSHIARPVRMTLIAFAIKVKRGQPNQLSSAGVLFGAPEHGGPYGRGPIHKAGTDGDRGMSGMAVAGRTGVDYASQRAV